MNKKEFHELTVESYDFGHVDNGHMHQRENCNDAAVADSADDGVLQLSASIQPHQLRQEQSPQAQPSSLHQVK